MGYVIKMPKLGMEMQEGELLEWVIDEGDAVTEGDGVAEIESEKTVTEVDAREDGVLRRIVLKPGAVVEPGTAMGVIAASDEPIDELLEDIEGTDVDSDDAEVDASSDSETGTEKPSPSRIPSDEGTDGLKISPRARKRADESGVDVTAISGSGMEGSVIEADVENAIGSRTSQPKDVKATPKAKTVGRELDVDLAGVEGTGPQNAVTAGDVHAASNGGASTPRSPSSGPTQNTSDETRRTVREAHELSGMRRTIASRLGESYRNAVHVTVSRDIEVEELLSAKTVADRTLDADVSLSDMLLVCLSATLDGFPEFNATYEDDTHRLYEEQNVGVAVDVEDGLVTPVLDDIGAKSLPELAAARRRLTDAVLSGQFTTDDLSNGTFTMTNLGAFGVDSFTPIINPPQIAILGVSRVREEPVRGENGVEFRKRIRFDLSFDHRVVDGADAARFMQTFAGHIHEPWALLLQRT